MSITISGENNNDRILAQDGVIDEISGINIVGLLTAGHINVGSNINLGNAGIITATTFVGNLTGNVNSTSPLLLQTGGSERFRITGNNELGIAGANYGSSGQVLTSGGSGNAVTWSAIPSQVSISNNADNRVITGGSGVNLNGEANLTFDGSTLGVNGNLSIADKIIHTGDTNTFIRFLDAGDIISMTVGNSEKVKVELGDITIPNAHLKLVSDNHRLKLGASNDFQLSHTGTVNRIQSFVGNIEYISPTGSGHSFQINSQEKLRINSSGNLLLGTTSSAAGQLIIKDTTNAGNQLWMIGRASDDTSSVSFRNNADNAYIARIQCDSNAGMQFEMGGSEKLRIDSSGRMMIGNTAAGQMYSGADNLVIGTTSGENGITIISQSNSIGRILFSDSLTSGAATYQGQLNYNHSADELVISTYTLGQIVMKTSNTERLRINSGGNIVFGGNSSTGINGQRIFSFKNLDTTSSSTSMTVEHHFNFNRTGGGMDHSAARIIAGKEREWVGGAANQDGYLAFHTMINESSTEKFRITSAGALLIGSTTQNDDELFRIFTSSTSHEMISLRNNSAGTKDMITLMNVNNSGAVMLRFKQTGGLTNVGTITTSSNSTSYNTSSDYRLKENAVAISDGITRLKTLKPYRFNFKTEPTKTVDGFFAHEVTAVPEAVNGEKDAVETTYYKDGDTLPDGKVVGDIKEENSVLPQSLDYAKLTPLLTAALQEAITKIETLESKVAALEGS